MPYRQDSSRSCPRRVASQRQILFETHRSSHDWAPIRADEGRLTEAIYHLVHNGIKYNQPGGNVHVRYRLDGESVAFEVQDTGAGIPEEKLEMLWDPFSQVADPSSATGELTGLITYHFDFDQPTAEADNVGQLPSASGTSISCQPSWVEPLRPE